RACQPLHRVCGCLGWGDSRLEPEREIRVRARKMGRIVRGPGKRYNRRVVGSRRRGLGPVVAACALAAWISSGGPAEARSRTQFYFRVDLATYAVTPLREVDVGSPFPRAKTPSAGWWKPTPGGRKPEIRIKTLEKKPFTRCAHPHALAVIADDEEQLRLPSPARTGELLWYVVQND